MAEFKNQTLTGDQFVDGNTYSGILFKDSRLIYAGGTPPNFDNCSFEGGTFSFIGGAGLTLSFLRAMAPANTNMRGIVLGLIPELND